MCGFVGIYKPDCILNLERERMAIYKMADAIQHRGPDSDGYWFDASSGIALAHRRLAIVELSPLGAQPMVSQHGRYTIVFNGEIYNNCDLRKIIDGSNSNSEVWFGSSDTETILKCLESWGIEKTLQELVGMFALGIWDRSRRELVLVRDRFGEKPLYYGFSDSGKERCFLFGSDLRAIRRHPSFDGLVDRDALSEYMQNSCIGGESTIYSKFRKLLPGHLLRISADKPEPIIGAWWDSVEIAVRSASQRFTGSTAEACEQLEALTRQSIRQQMMADVPVGAFLSGGIDSSLVAALMQLESNRPIKTFSIGFNEKQFDEAIYAGRVAKSLGTEHRELYVSSSDAVETIPKLAGIYSEPFADSSQIPTYLVSRLARQNVTVALTGDGADEVFGGYSRYTTGLRLWKMLSLIPLPLRHVFSKYFDQFPVSKLNRLSGIVGVSRLGEKFQKIERLIESQSLSEYYQNLLSHCSPSENPVLEVEPLRTRAKQLSKNLATIGGIESMMLMDITKYLPDDILVKVDRASMGVSLETRIPFLDHRLVQFSWSLPLNYKIRNGASKWPLKKILGKYLQQELFARPKMGFGVPIGDWLRGPLRGWVEDQISIKRLKNEGFLNQQMIRNKWRLHLSGEKNFEHQLWNVLMFQSWLDKQND
jgi:asparagine synthase (glutamine-hydrolysing)